MAQARSRVAVELNGLQLFGHHGWLPEERAAGRPYIIDLKLELATPVRRDELGATVDYSEVIAAIRELNETREFKLLETFAQEIARTVLERFPAVAGVEVMVRKPRPPLPAGVILEEAVAVARLEREDLG